jgi:hypothetical protein
VPVWVTWLQTMAARPAASIRVINPLECQAPMTFANARASGTATSTPNVAWAGIGSNRAAARLAASTSNRYLVIAASQ